MTNLTGAGSLSASTGVTIANNGSIDMRNNAAATFNVGNNLTLPGAAKIYTDLVNDVGTPSDILNVSGTVTVNGATAFLINPQPTVTISGTYTVMQYGTWAGSGTLSAANALNSRSTVGAPIRDDVAKVVQVPFNYVAPKALTWSAGTYGLWDVKASTNWNSAADQFYDLDSVTFGDAGGAATVTLYNTNSPGSPAVVNPGSIIVDSPNDYSITPTNVATDKISGTSGLTKRGAGALTISTVNDYSGTTSIEGGILHMGIAGALGSTDGGTSVNGGTLDINGISLGNEPVTVQGAGAGGIGTIVNNGPTGTGAASQTNAIISLTLGGDATIGGSSDGVNAFSGRWDIRGTGATLNTGGNAYNLTKVGSNQISLVGATVDSALANVTINGGVLSIETSTNGLGDSAKTVTINTGGTLQFYQLATPLNKNVALNGGSISVWGNSTPSQNTISGNITISSSGGTFDTGAVRTPDRTAAATGLALTVTGSISGTSGTLTMVGPGTVTLTNTNPFSGTTNLNDGNLIVNGSLGGGVTLAASPTSGVITTLSGTGTVGGTTQDAYGTRISPASNGVAGTFNLNNLIFNDGGQIYMDLTNNPASGNDLLNLGGDLSLVPFGSTTVYVHKLSSDMGLGTYHLIHYAGSKLSGSAAANMIVGGDLVGNARQTYTFTDATQHYIDLVVAGVAADLVWNGTVGNDVWDVNNTSNKVWLNGATPDLFYNNDRVTFNDNAAVTSVNLNTVLSVSIGSMIVNNNTKTYTFAGMAKITGSGGLTKQGTGTLILANTGGNDYLGTTTISAGILQIGDGASPSASIGSGAVANNGQLVFDQIEDYALSNSISGSGILEKKNTYPLSTTLTVPGNNSYDGVTLVSGGTLKVGSATALGSTVGGTTVANGAALDVNGTNLGAEAITVQGDGISSAGAILNTGAAQQNALRLVTLTGDTTFGGVNRWDIRTDTPATVPASLTGNGKNLTKVGVNQIFLVNLGNMDLGNVNLNAGEFGIQGTTTFVDGSTGDLSKPITVITGASMTLWSLPATNVINKKLTLQGGTLQTTSGAGTNNTYGGEVTLVNDPITGISGTLNTAASTAMTISGSIVGTGPLVKAGSGTATLTGASTFSGALNVNAGTLILTGSLSAGVTMTGAGVTLTGTGTINGASNDYPGAIISPGATAASGSIGTLSFGGDLTLGGSGQINLDMTSNPSGTNDLIEVGGTLAANSVTNMLINASSGYLQGNSNYHLIHYNNISGWSSASMAITGVATDGRQTYSFSNSTSPNYIDLVTTGSGANLTWVGDGSGNAWDVKTTPNWNGGSDSLFWNGDFVTFDDSSTNTTVNINQTLYPSSITVSTGKDYTFTGTGSILGGTLTKQGTGTLTFALTSSSAGLVKVENGVLYVTGGLGNNSPVLITGGTLRAGSNTALGSTNAVGTTINGGTLDVNGYILTTEPVTVQGAGVGGNGAIINTGVQQINAVALVTMSGDATFGGAGPPGGSGWNRWDIRGTGASLNTNGQPYNLTKVGGNQVSFVAATVDPALANITINGGFLGFETSTNGMGDPSKTVTVNTGGTLHFYGTTNTMTKQCVLNGGTIWSANSANTFAGPINITSAGGILDAGSGLTGGAPSGSATLTLSGPITGSGGVTKNGPNTVFITGTPSYGGGTTINQATLQINSGGSVTLHAITGAGNLGVDNTTNLTVDSVEVGVLTVGAGSTLTIAPIPGGPLAGPGSFNSVPEPCTWAMLVLAAMGLGIYWRRSR